MNLSEAVKEYRLEHRYSLREFADLCGLSHVQIRRIETGVKTDGQPFEPKIKTLKKLAAGMGITLDEVLRYCEDMVIQWDPDDVAISTEKQALIDRVLRMDSAQLDKLARLLDIVEGK